MSTFTRIIHKRVGNVSSVDTYSMRGSFTPDEALRALSKIDREEVVTTLKVDIAPAFEQLKRWESQVDTVGIGHPNCRCTSPVKYPINKYPIDTIENARRSLHQSVVDGAPIALRRKIQRRISTLLRAKLRLSPKAMRRVKAIRKRNAAKRGR